MKSKRVNEEQNALVPNGKAVGLGKNSSGGYELVVLEFDSESGESRMVRTIDVGSSKLEAAERFKVLAVEEGLVV